MRTIKIYFKRAPFYNALTRSLLFPWVSSMAGVCYHSYDMAPNSLKTRRFRGLSLLGFFLGAVFLLSLGVFAIWTTVYSDPLDPKNIHYALGKHGFNKGMNLDSALVAMSHDNWPNKLAQTLTGKELRNRFGYIRAFHEVTPYLRECYATPGSAGPAVMHHKKKNVVFFMYNRWMVLIPNGRAVCLTLSQVEGA